MTHVLKEVSNLRCFFALASLSASFLQVLIGRLNGVKSMIEECESNFDNEEVKCVQTLLELLSVVVTKVEVLQSSLKSKSLCSLPLVLEFHIVLKHGLECLEYLNGLEVAKQTPYVADLTDAGPKVGVTNHEFCYRIAQEMRIADYQYYIRHHLAPADSSHNEAERIQSYVGDAICDGSYINWEHCKMFSGSDENEVQNCTIKDLEALETEQMRINAFKVCEEVALRIDGAVAPGGFLKAVVSNDMDGLFFWDRNILVAYISHKNSKR